MNERERYSASSKEAGSQRSYEYLSQTRNSESSGQEDFVYTPSGIDFLKIGCLASLGVVLGAGAIMGLAWLLHEFKDFVQ